jgi:hypothetical protein
MKLGAKRIDLTGVLKTLYLIENERSLEHA